MNNSNPESEIKDKLEIILNEIYEIYRPRVFFDIIPHNKKINILVVTLRNAGRTPAYNITCKFEPDIPYYEGLTLSKLSIFKNLSYLLAGDKIEFTFNSFPSYISDSNNPTQFNVTISYNNSRNHKFEESYVVDINRYRGLLLSDEKDLTDIHKILSSISHDLKNLKRGFGVTRDL